MPECSLDIEANFPVPLVCDAALMPGSSLDMEANVPVPPASDADLIMFESSLDIEAMPLSHL